MGLTIRIFFNFTFFAERWVKILSTPSCLIRPSKQDLVSSDFSSLKNFLRTWSEFGTISFLRKFRRLRKLFVPKWSQKLGECNSLLWYAYNMTSLLCQSHDLGVIFMTSQLQVNSWPFANNASRYRNSLKTNLDEKSTFSTDFWKSGEKLDSIKTSRFERYPRRLWNV